MFEECGDAELLALMGEAQQCERAAFARQLLAVGRFAMRRMDAVYAEHQFWCVDDWEAIAAEIGAELGISRGRASSQMEYGKALIKRFPKLAAVFAAGQVDFRVIAAAGIVVALAHRHVITQGPRRLAVVVDEAAASQLENATSIDTP